MIKTAVGISLFALASVAAWAQTSATPLAFEVASVKVAAPQNDGRIMRRMSGGPGTPDPGTLNYSNVTLKGLAVQAYDLKDYQVEGPEWMDSNGYDITAKLAPGTTAAQFRQMMQTLLTERFKLTVHRETKQLPVYALVVAKGGSKMKEVEVPATPVGAPGAGRGADGGPGRGGGGGRGPGIRMMMGPGGSRQMAGYMTMTDLSNMLTRSLDRAVIDATELKATYDVNFTWTPDEMDRNAGMMGGGPPDGGRGGGGGDPHVATGEPALTLAQALQEKLGLKLEARKSSAEMLIVDHAEKVPVEN